MTKDEAKAILIQAFSACTPEQMENLMHHVAQDTPVLCGKENYTSFTHLGAG